MFVCMHGSDLGYQMLLDFVFFCALKWSVLVIWFSSTLWTQSVPFTKPIFARCLPEGRCIRYSFCNEKYNWLTSDSSLTSKKTMTSYQNLYSIMSIFGLFFTIFVHQSDVYTIYVLLVLVVAFIPSIFRKFWFQKL